jgi:hypothetical protein
VTVLVQIVETSLLGLSKFSINVMMTWRLGPERCFSADPLRRKVARDLCEGVKELPLVCPHGHTDLNLLTIPDALSVCLPRFLLSATTTFLIGRCGLR